MALIPVLLPLTEPGVPGDHPLIPHLVTGVSADHLTQAGTVLRVFDQPVGGTAVVEITGAEGPPVFTHHPSVPGVGAALDFLDEEGLAYELRRLELWSPAGLLVREYTPAAAYPTKPAALPWTYRIELALEAATDPYLTPEGMEHVLRLVTGESADHLDASTELRVSQIGDGTGTPDLSDRYEDGTDLGGPVVAVDLDYPSTHSLRLHWYAVDNELEGVWNMGAVDSPGGVRIWNGPLGYVEKEPHTGRVVRWSLPL